MLLPINDSDCNSEKVSKKRKRKKSNDISVSGKRKVGRPKKVQVYHGLTSITKFFRPLK